MKFCQSHWDALRHAITVRGMGDFVAANEKEAAKNMMRELKGEPLRRRTFDPLMAAHNTILGNAMDFIRGIGNNPLMLMAGDSDHPEWECPICCLNWLSEEHDRICKDPTCTKEKGLRFDDWIDKAADGAAEMLKELK